MPTCANTKRMNPVTKKTTCIDEGKMAKDWKDILGTLNVPQGEDHQIAETKESQPAAAASRGVTLFFERKGRGGKTVTILADFVGVDDAAIKQLASELKQKLGCGGSVDGGEILIQGDRRADIKKLLTQRGYKVKGA